jgi:hypothetical protein
LQIQDCITSIASAESLDAERVGRALKTAKGCQGNLRMAILKTEIEAMQGDGLSFTLTF